jgi:internalin A
VSNSPEAVVPPEAAVAFADPTLESVVRAIIKVPDGDIMPEDLLDVTEIDAPQRNIRDLEGIQYCVSLRRLTLRSNAVAQLGPLAGLVQLSDLDLSSNQLSDIGPLSDLASMMNLNLSDNAITEIGALQRLEVLNFLWLDRNRITDLGPVAGCWRLNHLFVSDNQVVDLAPLGSMEFVGDLDLSGNLIVDVAPLVANDAFATGDHIWLARNPLSATALDEQIPALRARGVVVHTE